MSLSLRRQRVLAILPKITGGISFVSSITIAILILCSNPIKRQKVYHRLVLGMSLADASSSLWLALSTWPIPKKDSGGILWAVGNTATCRTQGFFTQFGISSPLYNVSLSLYYVLAIRYNWKEDQLSCFQWQLLFHAIPLGWAFITATAGLPLDLYHSANLWCFIAPNNNPNEDNNFNIFRWVFFYIPLWLGIIFVTMNLILVFLYVRTVTLRSERYAYNQRQYPRQPNDEHPPEMPSSNRLECLTTTFRKDDDDDHDNDNDNNLMNATNNNNNDTPIDYDDGQQISARQREEQERIAVEASVDFFLHPEKNDEKNDNDDDDDNQLRRHSKSTNQTSHTRPSLQEEDDDDDDENDDGDENALHEISKAFESSTTKGLADEPLSFACSPPDANRHNHDAEDRIILVSSPPQDGDDAIENPPSSRRRRPPPPRRRPQQQGRTLSRRASLRDSLILLGSRMASLANVSGSATNSNNNNNMIGGRKYNTTMTNQKRRQQQQQQQQVVTTAAPTTTTTNTTTTTIDSIAKKRQQVALQCFRYALAFYLTWIPITLVRIFQTFDPPKSVYGLLVWAAIATPLQGLPNFIIYLYPTYVRHLQAQAKKKRQHKQQQQQLLLQHQQQELQQQIQQQPLEPQKMSFWSFVLADNGDSDKEEEEELGNDGDGDDDGINVRPPSANDKDDDNNNNNNAEEKIMDSFITSP